MIKRLLLTLLFLFVSFNVFASTTINSKGRLVAGESVNCGLSISGTTLTVTDKSGGALSGDNFCLIGIKSDGTGLVDEAKFSSPITVDLTNDLDGNLFGISEADWANNMPVFLSVTTDGTTPLMALSRLPIRTSGTAGQICKLNDTSCDGENSILLFSSDATVADYASKPLTYVAWMQGTYATSGNVWTITLNANSGFNKDYEIIDWSFPSGQMGASSGKYILENGGTAPTFTTQTYFYNVRSNGECRLSIYFSGNSATDGATAVVSNFTIPFIVNTSLTDVRIPISSLVYNGTGIYTGTAYAVFKPTDKYFTIERQSLSGSNLILGASPMYNSYFGDADRALITDINYKCY